MIHNFNVNFFQAINDQKSCNKFLNGHQKVLQKHGISNITTNNSNWFSNPSVYAVTIEKQETNEIVGGIRVHLADGKTPLPLEDAVGGQDPKVYSLIKERTSIGITGEICGLWHSKELRIMGFSKILVRALLAITEELNMDSLFALNSNYIQHLTLPLGFKINKSLCVNGDFLYPNNETIARISELEDLKNLTNTQEEERKAIMILRNNPSLFSEERVIKGLFSIQYNLNLSQVSKTNIFS